MSIETIDTATLQGRLSTGSAQLLDVRLADEFAEAHLPGAVSNCVFEVAFAERLADTAPDKSAPVIVYGAWNGSHESRMAADKLERLGYQQVLDYRDGLAGWKAANGGLQETPPSSPSPINPPHGHLEIDLAESRIEWTGRNLLNKHWGNVALASGHLEFDQGRLIGGAFVIDLKRMLCHDLEGQMHDTLIAHLQSDDFFDVERYPTARFEILSSEPLPDGNASRPNLRIHGELTLRGESNPLSIDATTGLSADGKPVAQATLTFDRTLWGSIYGSARFFHRLGAHLVNDLVNLQLRVVAA